MNTENERAHVRILMSGDPIEVLIPVAGDCDTDWAAATITEWIDGFTFLARVNGSPLVLFFMKQHERSTWRRAALAPYDAHMDGCSWTRIGECSCDAPIGFAPVVTS